MKPNLTDITANERAPKLDDIQGLILRGYNLPFVRYIIFTINDVEGARRFCEDILPGSNASMNVTTALPWHNGIKPDYCLNIGFTASGLEKMITKTEFNKVSGWSLDFFSAFKAGAVKTAAKIGDTGESAPDKWWKGDGWITEEIDPAQDGSDLHIQVTLFAHDSKGLTSYYNTLLSMVPRDTGGMALSPVFFKDSEPLSQGDDYIHFGYKDSFSQPRLTAVPWNTTQGRLLAGKSTIDDRPVVSINQFVIGISKVSVDPQPLRYNPHPLLENGSFAAFRLLYQDVAAFNKYINSATDGTRPELVAAKMCGRWFDGTPLVVSPDKPNPELKNFDYTNFNYITPTANQQGNPKSDDLGQLCPYAAHIRRANPRDDEKVKGNSGLAADAKTRRIMRRAGPYGPDYRDDEVAKKDGGVEIKRGLVGLFICANLTQQFIFIMDSWINHGGFRSADNSPNSSGADPLFGPSKNDYAPNNEFDYLPDGPTDQPYKRMPGLERFVRTDGSLFLFLPGIKALEDIANGIIPTKPQS
jgi:deferrochelatase/peroxidase EfeB